MQEEIKRCVNLLQEGKVLVYPTDTIWGIGCDATQADAIHRIFDIKRRRLSKSMLILLDDAEKLRRYVRHVPEIAWDILATTSSPTTYIYPDACNLPPIMIPEDGTIAIRIVKDGFCHELIKALDRPLVSTSANITTIASPQTFSEISPAILEAVDYVVPERFCDSINYKSSRIIRFLGDEDFVVIRE